MKTFDKLYEDWGNATDGKSIEEFIYDYMADELFVERQLVKVKQKEKEMMAEQLKHVHNKAIDEAIERLSSYRDIDRTQMKEVLESLKTAHGEH